MRHRDVQAEHRAATKEILESVEMLARKYNITPDDYNMVRAKVKSKIFRLSNAWHMFFAAVVDAKFNKKINEAGENLETHLDG